MYVKLLMPWISIEGKSSHSVQASGRRKDAGLRERSALALELRVDRAVLYHCRNPMPSEGGIYEQIRDVMPMQGGLNIERRC